MTFAETLTTFFQTEAGKLAVWVLILPVADFLLGVSAAVRDSTFTLDVVASFLRKQLAGRVFPIWGLLLLGEFAKNFTIPIIELPAVTSLGVAAAGVYLLETIGSIFKSWGSTSPTAPAILRRDTVQPVPVA